MRVTLKTKLFLVTMASVVTIGALALGAISTAGIFSNVLARSNAATIALRTHTVSDMLHDAIRADVYRAQYVAAKWPLEKDAVKGSTHGHAGVFRAQLTKIKLIDLPPDVRSALAEAEPAVDKYISSGEKLVALAFEDGAKAEAQIQDFERQFSALEIKMENIGDKIESFAKKEFDNAEDFVTLAKRLSEFGLLLGVFISAWAVFVMRHDVLSPLGLMIGAMKKLAEGNVETTAPQLLALQSGRFDELGEMARAVEVFRTNAVARNKMTRESRILSDLNEWLQSAKSETELYQMIATFVSRMLPACTGSLYIYANSRDILECVKVWNGTQGMQTMHPDDCWGLRRGRTYSHGQNQIEFDCLHVSPSAGADYCCIPILAHGETVGLLHLEFVAKGAGADAVASTFAEERRLGLAAAEHISLAIANVKLREQLRDQSIRDVLTGLFNRRYMLETCRREFQRAARAGQSVSILSIDVDHFKTFNDNHGHDAGDSVLRCVGEALRTVFREEDVPCRFGGEEFVVLLPGAAPEVAARRAEELRSKIEALSVRYAEGNLPKVTVSIGVAAFPKSGNNPMEVLKVADEALYAAKGGGRNCVRLSPGCLDVTDDQVQGHHHDLFEGLSPVPDSQRGCHDHCEHTHPRLVAAE